MKYHAVLEKDNISKADVVAIRKKILVFFNSIPASKSHDVKRRRNSDSQHENLKNDLVLNARNTWVIKQLKERKS
jgi:hypothetical protein